MRGCALVSSLRRYATSCSPCSPPSPQSSEVAARRRASPARYRVTDMFLIFLLPSSCLGWALMLQELVPRLRRSPPLASPSVWSLPLPSIRGVHLRILNLHLLFLVLPSTKSCDSVVVEVPWSFLLSFVGPTWVVGGFVLYRFHPGFTYFHAVEQD